MTLPRFSPVRHSWVAIHPQAKGVIQFVGGAFFGTFAPTLFYRSILSFFYEQGYTIIIIPFNFSFNHYRESFFLVREQYALIPELVGLALNQSADPNVYLQANRYAWMGHSIGCKYVALLECASSLPNEPEQLRTWISKILDQPGAAKENENSITTIAYQLQDLRKDIVNESKKSLNRLNDILQANNLPSHSKDIENSIFATRFIKDQTSVLLAPVMSDTSSAIQPKSFANWVDRQGWGVQPTSSATKNLITASNRFNLLVVAEFKKDRLAKETINWFYSSLQKPGKPSRKYFAGGHLRPLGLGSSSRTPQSWTESQETNAATNGQDSLQHLLTQELEIYMQRGRPGSVT